MIDATQLRDLVVRPALEAVGMWSPSAENLVMGTAAAESGLRYLAQIQGPALGLWQCEPATHTDQWRSYLDFRKERAKAVMLAAGRGTSTPRQPPDDWLVFNLRYAAVMCRVKYWRVDQPLPVAHDIEGMARYWSTFYNTPLGKGTVEHFVRAYELVM